MERGARSFELTIHHLWLLLPFVWMALIVGRSISDNSFLWHVRAGTAQLSLGRVFTSDPFSYTATGEPWRTQSWLVELGYGWLENLTGGIGWVHFMLMAVVALTMVAIGMAVYRATGGRLMATAVALVVVAWQAGPFAVPRPVIFSYLGLALVVLVLQRSDADLWILPPLIWGWAAVHGSFVLGIGLIGLDAIRRSSVRRAATAAASFGLASLTAHGLGVWQILVDFLQARGALELISEWQRPELTNPFVWPLAIVVAGVIAAAVTRRLRARDALVILPFVVFGMLANRNLYPATIVLIPFAATMLARAEPEPAPRGGTAAVNWAFVVLAVVWAFSPIGFNRPVSLNEARFPDREAFDVLDSGPVWHGTAMGGYLIYAEWPERLVFIDDRAEFFGADRFRQFHEVRIGDGYEELFTELGIRQAIVDKEWDLATILPDRGWDVLWEDEYHVIVAVR